MKKKLVISLAALLIVFGTVFGAYRIKGNDRKDVATHFFPQKSQEYIRNMMIYNEDTHKYDGVIYTLENSVYVEKCDMGYYVISVKQEDGGSDRLENMMKTKELKRLGSYEFEFELEGNILYCYGAMAGDGCKAGQVWFHAPVPPDPEMYNWKALRFNLKDSGGAKVYGSETFEADVCPIGIRVIKDGSIRTNEVVLNYSNGKNIVIYKNEYDESGKRIGYICEHSMYDSFSTMGGLDDIEYGKNCFITLFDEWFDISELESITVNGEVLELISE